MDEEGVWSHRLVQELSLSCGADGYIWEVERSAKSTPPDRAILPEGGHVAGGWVKLVGIKGEPELNGCIAVILEVCCRLAVLLYGDSPHCMPGRLPPALNASI